MANIHTHVNGLPKNKLHIHVWANQLSRVVSFDIDNIQGDLLVIQGDLLVIQGDLLVIQGDLLVIQGDLLVIQGLFRGIY